MNRIGASLLFLILLATSTQAQILNFNKRLLQSDSVKWLGQVRVYLTLIDQEVSVANMGYNFDVVRKFKKHSVMAISKLSFARSNSETLLSDGYAHVRAIFNRDQRFGEEVFGQIQYNAIRGLEDRTLVGAGFRYILMDKEKYGMIVGTGIIQEWENWIADSTIINNSLIKSSNYVSFFGDVNEHFHFNIISYYQASYSNFLSPRISLEVNLNVNITKKIVFTSSLTTYYEKDPVIPIKNFIYKFKNGLGYRF